MRIEYKNRYNDTFTFSKTEDGNILWEGNFEWVRMSYPNIYDDAYNTYLSDTDIDKQMTMSEFKEAIHEAIFDENRVYKYMSVISQKYAKLISPDKNVIDSIDPSGGPYLCSSYDMGIFDPSFKGMIIEEFKSVPEGYLIIIKKYE
jgi:hypothetical protein